MTLNLLIKNNISNWNLTQYNGNIDNLSKSGLFIISSNAKNSPLKTPQNGYLLSLYFYGASAIQIVMGNVDRAIYIRSLYWSAKAVWSSWKRIN